MNSRPHIWAIVLAAGEGSRLRSLTTGADGQSIPKQYCSLFGRRTLLQDALHRGRAIAGRQRICTVVAAQHAGWWRHLRRTLWPDNIIVQPDNRGTANGVLLPLLAIVARDPAARVMFLPADHYVADESRLFVGMLSALRAIDREPDTVQLLGIEPDEADSELGYIVPGKRIRGTHRVERFVEKPAPIAAAALVDAGALWNSFIFASTARTLLSLLQSRAPEIVRTMSMAVTSHRSSDLACLYAGLPQLDFSRDVLTGAERRLRVVPVRGCGWTDLGTPRRIGIVLDRTATVADLRLERTLRASAIAVNLASAYRRSTVQKGTA